MSARLSKCRIAAIRLGRFISRRHLTIAVRSALEIVIATTCFSSMAACHPFPQSSFRPREAQLVAHLCDPYSLNATDYSGLLQPHGGPLVTRRPGYRILATIRDLAFF